MKHKLEAINRHHPHHLKIAYVICGLAALFYCYEYLLRIEPSVMVSDLMQSFAITSTGLGVLSAMYYYAYTPLQAVVGLTIDRYGPRRVLLTAILSCALGSYLFGASHDVYAAALGRLLIGVGSAFAFVGVMKLAAMWLPRNRFPVFVGITTSLGMVGAMIGDVGLSWVVVRDGWHQVVMFGSLIGILLFALFWVFVHDRVVHEETPFDQTMVVGWKKLGLSSLGILRDPQLWISGIIGCMMYLSLTVFAEMWGIPYLENVTQSATFAADLNSMVFLGWLVGSPLSGYISEKIKSRRVPLMFGSLLATLVMIFILLIPNPHALTLGFLLFLFGLFCSPQTLVFVVARESVSLRVTATAIGFINLLIMLGGAVVQPLVGFLLDLGWEGRFWHGARHYSVHDFTDALVLVPICMLISAYLAYKLKETYANG